VSIHRIITAPVAAAVALALGACGSGSTQATPTVTVTHAVTRTVTQTVYPTAEAVLTYALDPHDQELRLQWANDPNRAVLFRDYGKAGTLVARALADGKFGPVIKYNEWGSDLVPGQTGWGGIAANTGGSADPGRPSAFAWVYFRADGSIDWSKEVDDFSIDMGPSYIGLQHFLRELGDDDTPHRLSVDALPDRSDLTIYVPCFTDCRGRSTAGLVEVSNPVMLVAVETDAAKTLDANMTAMFGAGWRSLK
jgi:hypothetical protein